MKLGEYINSFPRGERKAVRDRIAKACGRSESCIKHYANGTRDIPAKQFKAIVVETGGAVQVDDLLSVYEDKPDEAA